MNWIPMEYDKDGLPINIPHDENNYYLVTLSDGDVDLTRPKHFSGLCSEDEWHWECYEDGVVVAYQSLPEPYKK